MRERQPGEAKLDKRRRNTMCALRSKCGTGKRGKTAECLSKRFPEGACCILYSKPGVNGNLLKFTEIY